VLEKEPRVHELDPEVLEEEPWVHELDPEVLEEEPWVHELNPWVHELNPEVRDEEPEVRELRNAIQRAMGRRPPGGLVIERQHIRFDKFEARASPTGHLVDVVGRTLEETQKRAIDLTLAHTKGNRSRAARMLGISRGMVRRHLGEPISGSDAEPVEGDDA
jgi:hypothetical protein